MRTEIVEVTWISPLDVILQSGLGRTFRSVNDARLFLEEEWPVRQGNHYERALMYCQAAEYHQVSPDVAREAFLAACLEAGLEIGRSNWKSGLYRNAPAFATHVPKQSEPPPPLPT